MASTALARSNALPAVVQPEADFTLHDLRVFNSIPKHNHDVVVLHGMVVVYDTEAPHFEEVQEGGFYVVERQRTPSLMPWENWLKHELRDADGRAGPYSRLKTSREVIQAVRLVRPGGDVRWHYRLSSGYCDGPYYDWAIGFEFVGKVVGIYRPN